MQQQPPIPGQQHPQFQRPPLQQWQQQQNLPPMPYPEYRTRIPEPPKPKVPWYKKLFAWCRKHPIATAIIIVAFFAIGIIGNIVSPPQSTGSTSTDSTTQSTQQAQPTQLPTQKPKPRSIEQQINDIVQNAGLSGKNIKSMYNVGGDNYEKVQEDIGDGNLTNGLTVTEIRMDCFNVQKALWTQEKAHLSEVEVVVTMNVVDQYGNQSNQMVGDCDLKSTTEQLFNWSNLDQDMAWQDYDNTFIAPFLLK